MNVEMSDSAAARLATLLEKEPPGSHMRLSVEGGGCAGFSYKFSIETDTSDEDYVVNRTMDQKSAKLVVDRQSLLFVLEATVDFEEGIGGSFFKVNNPAAQSSCGCGLSFSM